MFYGKERTVGPKFVGFMEGSNSDHCIFVKLKAEYSKYKRSQLQTWKQKSFSIISVSLILAPEHLEKQEREEKVKMAAP